MPGRAALVYGEEFMSYRHGDWHPLQPVRVKYAVELMEATGLLNEKVERIRPRQAAQEELELIHATSYIELVKKLGHGKQLSQADLAGLLHSGFAHSDNPVFPDMHEASALIAGGSVQAAQLVHSGQADHAFNPAGGLHHAMRDSAWGFCVYNDVAVAVEWLKRNGHRVAVVDVDVHHGDGTQAAFYGDPDVLTISLHGFYRNFFPGTGEPSEIGTGPGRGASANVPLPAFTWDEPWLHAFTQTVPRLVKEFAPTVLVTQDGCDTHVLDPLAELRCSTRIWPVIAKTFHELAHDLCKGRWVVLGGGGYAVEEVVPKAWTLLVAEMVDEPDKAAHLLDEKPFPPVPEAQERIWPVVERSLAELDRALAAANLAQRPSERLE
jgi:acetoin utilization protein AcuC